LVITFFALIAYSQIINLSLKDLSINQFLPDVRSSRLIATGPVLILDCINPAIRS